MKGLWTIVIALTLAACGPFVQPPDAPAPMVSNAQHIPLPKPRPKHHAAPKQKPTVDCSQVRWGANNLSRDFIRSLAPNYTPAQRAEAARCLR